MVHRSKTKLTSGYLLVRLCITFILTLFALPSICQDKQSNNEWSQWMGDERKGIWNLDLQKESLNTTDLIKRWEVPVSTGYCGPTVSDGKVFLMDYVGDVIKSERVICFDAESGKQLWSHMYECSYSVGYPTGPRASVIIEEGRAYSLGTMGDLYCLDANSGKMLWHVDGEKDYNIDFPIWGISASPIIEADLLIVQIGGTPDACLVAFDKITGKEVWRALSDNASYSSPIVN